MYKESGLKFTNDSWIRYAHIQKGKTDIRKNAVEFIKENLDVQIYTGKNEDKGNIFETYEEMSKQYNKDYRR
jgi:hypothetical protein